MDINGHTPLYEDYVSFEVAKLLKEKGFDEDCIKVYINEKLRDVITKESIEECTHCFNHYLYPGDATAPTHQMVLKWLREIHHLYAEISIGSDSSTDADGNIIEEWYYWTYSIRYTIDGHIIYDNDSLLGTEYQSYEEAVEAAIKYCLINLI